MTAAAAEQPLDRAAVRRMFLDSLGTDDEMTGDDVAGLIGRDPRTGRHWAKKWREEAERESGSVVPFTGAGPSPAPVEPPQRRVVDRSGKSGHEQGVKTGTDAELRTASRHHTPAVEPVSPAVRWLATIVMLAVAAIAAVLSYRHQQHLAAEAGEGWASWLLPGCIDLVVVGASLALYATSRAGQRSKLAVGTLIVGIALSVVANMLAAKPTLIGWVVAAVPPISLFVAYELFLKLVTTQWTTTKKTAKKAREKA